MCRGKIRPEEEREKEKEQKRAKGPKYETFDFIFFGKMDRVFCNFSQLRIRGLLREGDGGIGFPGQVRVFVEDSEAEFLCLDVEKGEKLCALGLGGCMSLYNVTLLNGYYLITNQSGIRAVKTDVEGNERVKVVETESVVIDVIELQSRSRKWNCLLCNFCNFELTSICYSCGKEKRSGPVGPDILFKHLMGPPYEHKPWDCPFCFARKNSCFKDSCWKCLQDKPTSKTWKKKQRIR
jgi:hypothetical protein